MLEFDSLLKHLGSKMICWEYLINVLNMYKKESYEQHELDL